MKMACSTAASLIHLIVSPEITAVWLSLLIPLPKTYTQYWTGIFEIVADDIEISWKSKWSLFYDILRRIENPIDKEISAFL